MTTAGDIVLVVSALAAVALVAALTIFCTVRILRPEPPARRGIDQVTIEDGRVKRVRGRANA